MAECLQKPLDANDSNYGYDTDNEDDYEEFCENFTFSQSSSCCVCNGYYAPSFGEPLCGTCHAFLFPVIEEKRSTDLSDNDEDSGNDEPPYRDVAAASSTNRNDRYADVSINDNDNDDGDDENNSRRASPLIEPNEVVVPVLHPKVADRIAIHENAFLGNRPEPEPPRNLRQYLSALTELRDEFVNVYHNNGKSAATQLSVASSSSSSSVLASSSNAKPSNTICALPVEVLLAIFSYLDDLSLCNVGEVCKQWRKILEVHTPQTLWQKYTKQRWPLYHQITKVTNWFNIYSSLMSSCFCRTCLVQMTLRTPQQGENHFRATRLRGDIRTLDVDAAEGIEAVPLDNQLSHWQASIIGPVGSPYEGGKFFLHIIIPFSYPMCPPVVRFLTKIVHPNVSRHGDVGIDIIQHNWSLAITISKLLLSVQSLLTDPFTEICMEPELGRMYDHDRSKFEALARRWTWKYAIFEAIPS